MIQAVVLFYNKKRTIKYFKVKEQTALGVDQ